MSGIGYRDVCDNALPDLAAGQTYEVPNPLRHRTWIDETGTSWRRRGDDLLRPKQASRLLTRDDVLLMHVYGGAAHAHDGPGRRGMIADIQAVWSDNDPNAMRTFDLGEFRDDAHGVMIMVVEGC